MAYQILAVNKKPITVKFPSQVRDALYHKRRSGYQVAILDQDKEVARVSVSEFWARYKLKL
jgi:hypothetical protein